MANTSSTSQESESKNLVLRTIYIDPQLDEWLKQEAFASGVSKNDVIRSYIQLGIMTGAEQAQTNSALRKYRDVIGLFGEIEKVKLLRHPAEGTAGVQKKVRASPVRGGLMTPTQKRKGKVAVRKSVGTKAVIQKIDAKLKSLARS